MNRFAVENLFGIEGLDIAWYGIIIAIGIVVGVLIAVYEAKRRGYTSELLLDFMIIALPLAIICARIYYVAFEWDYYSAHPEQIIAIWEGGIAIYGAIIGGLIAALIVSKWRKFPMGRLLDICAPGLIIGQAIGRWGNFVNQEAYGNLITNPDLMFFPFGVHVGDQWFMATFFYESVWNVGVFALLMWYARRAKHDGNVFAMYLIGYGIGRFWIEGIRIQTLQLFPGVPVSQFLSGVLIAVGVIYILVMRKRNKENVLYEGKYCAKMKEEKTV
ncbi:MAG: prolipoprotein diacylglyceryl transferase [Christensenellaceae bacterium]